MGRWTWIAAAAAATLLLVQGAAAAPLNPGDVVVKLDPKADLMATRENWEAPKAKIMFGPDCKPMFMKAPKHDKPFLKIQPFTVTEVAALAQKAGRYGEINKIRYVMLPDGTRATLQVYTDQLNAIETFVNGYGRSLREADQDLGNIARLRPQSPAPSCSKHKLRLPILKPKELEPGDPVMGPGDPLDWGMLFEKGNPAQQPGLRKRLEGQAPRASVDLREARAASPLAAMTPRRQAAWGQTNGLVWISPKELAAGDVFAASRNEGAGRKPVAAGGLSPSIASSLLDGSPNPFNLRRLRGGLLESRVGPGGPPVTVQDESDCPEGTGVALNPICDDPNDPQCAKGAGGAEEKDTGGGITATKGVATACLRQGLFHLSMEPWNACVGQNGGFGGWFGASSCIAIASKNDGADGVFHFENSVGMNTNLTLFGIPMELISADAQAVYDSAAGPQTGKSLTGLVVDLGGVPCCEPIEGPKAAMPIGPLLLVITSQMKITLDPGEMTPTAASPKAGCTSGPVTVTAVAGKAYARSEADFDAAISAVVASAGVNGNIIFTDDTLQGSITTVADVGANTLTITPNMQYDMTRLAGSLSAFVEVDLFVTSKRWSVELASWDGFHTVKSFPKKQGVVSAVKAPEPDKKCPLGF